MEREEASKKRELSEDEAKQRALMDDDTTPANKRSRGTRVSPVVVLEQEPDIFFMDNALVNERKKFCLI
jgi:hypothetical protein